jgi:hypothetical protein
VVLQRCVAENTVVVHRNALLSKDVTSNLIKGSSDKVKNTFYGRKAVSSVYFDFYPFGQETYIKNDPKLTVRRMSPNST